MKTSRLVAVTSIATALLVTPAMANDQLARSLGVQPGTLTTSELIMLRTAREEDDHQRIDLLMDRSAADGRSTSSRSAATTPGSDQLARSLGVAPGHYTTAELQMMRVAIEENDAQRLAMLLEQPASSADPNTSAGHARLARAMRVDPADYTTAELSRMFIGAYD